MPYSAVGGGEVLRDSLPPRPLTGRGKEGAHEHLCLTVQWEGGEVLRDPLSPPLPLID